MTQKSSNLNELLAVVERIRLQVSPEIPSKVLQDVLMVEFENQDNRPESMNKCRKIINDYIDSIVTKKED